MRSWGAAREEDVAQESCGRGETGVGLKWKDLRTLICALVDRSPWGAQKTDTGSSGQPDFCRARKLRRQRPPALTRLPLWRTPVALRVLGEDVAGTEALPRCAVRVQELDTYSRRFPRSRFGRVQRIGVLWLPTQERPCGRSTARPPLAVFPVRTWLVQRRAAWRRYAQLPFSGGLLAVPPPFAGVVGCLTRSGCPPR